MSQEPTEQPGKLTVINKEFTYFIVGRILFIGGLRMTPVLLGWKLYEITHSKLALGMLGLSEVIPAILLALPAGVKVDRSDKRTLIANCMILYLLLMGLLLGVTADFARNLIDAVWIPPAIYSIVFLTGVVRAYSGPAFNAFLAQVVPSTTLVKAASINSMAWLSAAVAGPAVGGILLGYTNITIAFALVCLMVLAGFIIFSKIDSKPVSYQPGNNRTWASVKEGLHFVFKQKALLGAMSLDMFAVLFGGATALLPVFAKDILLVGPQGLGWLIAATYLGNFVAIARLTYKPLHHKQGRLLLYMVGGFGICMLAFALSGSFWISFLALFASGLFDGVSMVIRNTIMQLFVPDTMRGRVSSVNSIFVNSSNELGQFESGVAASILGTIPSVIFGGCMTLGITVVAWWKAKGLKELEY